MHRLSLLAGCHDAFDKGDLLQPACNARNARNAASQSQDGGRWIARALPDETRGWAPPDERDSTIAPRLARDVFARIGSSHKQAVVVDYIASQGTHVQPGDIRAPEATAPMRGAIVQWLRGQS